MPSKAAVSYHGSRQYNCAQAIHKAFDSSQEQVEEARGHGGGRAEEGLCGALHAGLSILHDKEDRERLHAHFLSYAKSLKCREIKKAKTLSCSDCVKVTAEFLEGHFESS